MVVFDMMICSNDLFFCKDNEIIKRYEIILNFNCNYILYVKVWVRLDYVDL